MQLAASGGPCLRRSVSGKRGARAINPWAPLQFEEAIVSALPIVIVPGLCRPFEARAHAVALPCNCNLNQRFEQL